MLGTQAAAVVLPRLAQRLAALRRQRDEVGKEVGRLVLAHPLCPVLTSMPGVAVRTAARLLIDVASPAFASAAHLAAYAGLAPVTRRSGSSIRGEHPSRRGNKQLKRALSCRRSQRYETPSPEPTTLARSARTNVTNKPSLRSPGVAVMSYSPCYEMALSTAHRRRNSIDNYIAPPKRLDRSYLNAWELRSMSRDSVIPTTEVEILRVQRRRPFTAEEKRRFVEETL